MELRWLCSVLIILVIISSTINTQTVVNKWQINEIKRQLVREQESLRMRLKSLHLHRSDDVQSVDKDNEMQYSDQNYLMKKDETELNSDEKSSKAHSRKKRLVWITDDGRLALPPGTVLSITPTLSLPLVRYPLSGFLSNITVSFPLTSKYLLFYIDVCIRINVINILLFAVDFDKLGLTDNENPLGVVPPVFGARSMGRAAGSLIG